jgi:ubiquinone/menaquinone biosynthesis C-methylase UbiE
VSVAEFYCAVIAGDAKFSCKGTAAMQNQASVNSGERAVTAFETNETYYSMMRDWHRQHGGVALEELVKRTIKSNCNPGSRILDAGCGEGSVARFYAKQYPEVKFHGMDVSPIGVAMASQGAPPNVRFSVGKLTQTGFESNSFNFIYSQSVIEHVEDWQGMLREMYRILKPGGSFMVRVENGGRMEKHLFRALVDVVFFRNRVQSCSPTFELTAGDVNAHMSNFDLHEIPSEILEKAMKKTGFTVSLSTRQEYLAEGSSGLKGIILRSIAVMHFWPFKHVGYTTIAIGKKS